MQHEKYMHARIFLQARPNSGIDTRPHGSMSVHPHIMTRTGTERETQRVSGRGTETREMILLMGRRDSQADRGTPAHNPTHTHKHPQHYALATASLRQAAPGRLPPWPFRRPCVRLQQRPQPGKNKNTKRHRQLRPGWKGPAGKRPCCRFFGCSRQTASLPDVTAAGRRNPFKVYGSVWDH